MTSEDEVPPLDMMHIILVMILSFPLMLIRMSGNTKVPRLLCFYSLFSGSSFPPLLFFTLRFKKRSQNQKKLKRMMMREETRKE